MLEQWKLTTDDHKGRKGGGAGSHLVGIIVGLEDGDFAKIRFHYC
jgi:hypothetical protein